ncbi:hypothetical protein R1sor_001070 [Riccia sorocarpa]|uniref:Uncharacterized protein n=1 Tax=Riccia sorocarpa TaxID=122646 RepID=A0ABD3GVT1_9MARC
MGREDVVYVDAGGPAFFLNRSVSPASSCSSSSSNSEMKPRAMARSVGAQKNAVRHRMTKQEYEMIVTLLCRRYARCLGECGSSWLWKLTRRQKEQEKRQPTENTPKTFPQNPRNRTEANTDTNLGNTEVHTNMKKVDLDLVNHAKETDGKFDASRTFYASRRKVLKICQPGQAFSPQPVHDTTTYLENPDNFAAINGCEKKTKITGKTLTKMTAYGHMAVTLCAQGFVKCSGVIMGKKVARYVSTYRTARTFYLGIGSGLTEAEIDAGLTLEQKMNAKCHFFFRMHALFGAKANVEPPAVGDAGLPAEIFFDDRDLCQDSQVAFQFSAAEPMLSGDEEEAADREEEPIDLSEDDEVDNQTAPQSRGDASVQSVDDVRSSGKTVRSKDRPPPPEHKTSLISAYEEQVKEKLVLKKEAQYQKASFRNAILEDRRQAREQRERARIQDGIEAMRRARADRRSTLLAEMVKTGKSMDEIHQYFLMLDNVEERLSGSM